MKRYLYRRLDELMAENRELRRRLALAEWERDTARARQQ